MGGWEWSLAVTNRVRKAQAPNGWHAANIAHCDAIADDRRNPACESCALFKRTCEGPSAQYQKRYGIGEMNPYATPTD